MRVITDLAQCEGAEHDHAVTIGTYDGVHLGHQAVIQATRKEAERRGLRSALVTFDPHPAMVVRPDSAPRLLVDLEQKLELIEACGVDTVLVVPFDEIRSSETPEEFVTSVLLDCLGTRAIVVGEDFHFGKDRAGDVNHLSELGQRYDFAVTGIALLEGELGDRVISSTAIRRCLDEGDVQTAAELLGRPHETRGPVVGGDERGRTIGFPTANIAVPHGRSIPGDGVYAAWYERPDGSVYPAAINIGKRPTFYQDAEHSLVEAHLIDFDGDLYGEQARVRFVSQLRQERRFDGIDALQAQLAQDVATAREALSTA